MNPPAPSPDDQNQKPKKNLLVQADKYMSIGFILPVSIFVGYAIGWWLDSKFGTKYLSLVFLLIGMVAGFVQMIRMAKVK